MAKADLGSPSLIRKPCIVSWGELLWDLFPDRSLLGGSAANVAYHAALLGGESWLLSAVGDDRLGARALSQLRRVGVRTEGVAVDPSAATGRVRVTFHEGEPRFSIEEGVAWDKIDPSPEAIETIHRADVFCFSTLAQRTPLMRSRLRTILTDVQRKGPPGPFGGARGKKPLCLLDLNLRPPFTDQNAILQTLRLAHVVKVNEDEERWVQEVSGQHDAARWLLHEFGVRLVAVTRGERGASLYTRTVQMHAAGIPQSGGDPIGAGDAFVAALGVALSRGVSLPRALEAANRHGAWVAGQLGAMPERPGQSAEPA